MNKTPTFDDIFAVMSAASVGDRAARVSLPDDPQLDDTATRFALALNILLDDLALTAADVQRELAERGRLASRLQALADASREFSAATGDVDHLLEVVARRLGELVGDMCAIRPVSEDGEWLEPRGGFYHRDPELLAAAREAMSTRQSVREGYSGRVILSGEPIFLPCVSPKAFAASVEPRFRAAAERLAITSSMTLPLLCRGRVVGVANLTRSDPRRPYDQADLHLVQSIADHAALAIANAGSYAAERAARSAVEKAQADMVASESRYRLMFEKSPLPKWVYDLDTLSFLAVNDAAIRHYGYSREEFLRMTIKDIRPAEDVPRLLAEVQHLRPVSGTQKWRHRTKDGTVITVEIGAHDFSFDGRRARLVVANDVTDRERAEELLRRSEARFTRLSESGMIGILVLDLKGTILEANDTFLRIVGLTRQELQFGVLRVQDITPAELRTNSEIALEQIKKEGSVGVFEKEYLRRDGTRVPVLVGGAMLDAQKNISFVLDITERKRLEQVRRDAFELETQNRRIQEASRMKSEFLANMSHELRTPLNAILGFSELLHDGVVPPTSPNYREYLGDVIKSGRHLLQLINDVLDLAKVEAGKVEFKPEETNLTVVVGEVLSIVRAIAVAKNIRLASSIDADLQEIFLDPARLKQILYNFVSNALKFTPAKGSVNVRAIALDEENFRLEVEDTGPGIAPEDIDKLFVEFQQLEAGAARQHGGTGLGLALTKRLAEAQGGSVGLRSTVGQGSVFYAVLPRRSSSKTAAPRFQRVRAAPAGATSVLVIEDDARDQDRLAEALSGAGYAVEVASTGAAALAACALRKFDAISLDLLLPDLSGQEVLRQIRAGGLNGQVPVVVVTIVGDRGAIAGFTVHDFLTKPIDGPALLSSLIRAGVRPEQPGAVLVVDDDDSSLKLMSAALAQLGYRSLPVQSGEEALRAAASTPPAAVVLDLLMPGMDGFEFLDRLRESPETRQTPVLVWTVKDLSAEEQARLLRSVQAITRKGRGGIPALLEDLRRFLSPQRSAEAAVQKTPVLVIDDNPTNLELLSSLLSVQGYEVRTAGHANEALQTLERFHPRLILMDIQMPGVDGLTLTRRLKAAPATRDITIVAVTAYAMKGDAEKVREAGCDGYVTKPIDTRTLSATLAGYLASAQEKRGKS